MPESQAGSVPESGSPPARDETFRLLVVATEIVVDDALHGEVGRRLRDEDAQVRLVAPAVTDSALEHALGDVDAARENAEERLERSLEALRREGREVEGTIGDSDPIVAIEDALADFPADEILVVTHPAEQALWLEGDLFDRARTRFKQPITHAAVSGAEVVDAEHAEAGRDDTGELEVEGSSRNMPALSVRDLAGIVVAVVGTTALVVLAATCGGEAVGGEATDAGCVARFVIAGVVALVNIAHVVGLVLFESVRYRGIWERLFAQLSLYVTPVAIVISLLVH